MEFSFNSNQGGPDMAGTRLNTVPKRYYGKYRGKVVDNIDPLFLGRILAQVPAISDSPTSWALPCVPYAGLRVGFYAMPPIEANVWIEFEAGDPDRPIWTGCFWEEGQTPLEAPLPGMKIFKTDFITLIINDDEEIGGVTLEVSPPAVAEPISITLNSAGIQISTEAVLEVNALDTNLTGESLTVEVGATELSGETVSIDTLETNIASLEVSIEGLDTNIASAAVSIEGMAEVTGDMLIDGEQPVIIPLG